MPLLYLDSNLEYTDPRTTTDRQYLMLDRDLMQDKWNDPDSEHEFYAGDGLRHTMELQKTGVYGVDFAAFPDPQGVRTDDAADFEDPNPYVADGNHDNGECSSPFDDIMPWSGIKRVTRTGGEMVEIPKFWYKLEQSGDGIKVQIANGPTEGFVTSPAHMDRGDGKGERDVVYVGRYHCDSSYRSTTGVVPINDITHSQARTGCQGVGDGYQMMDFATRFTIWLLYLVEFANWDSQTRIGYGCGDKTSVQAMGYTDDMTYHAGTTQTARTTFGCGIQYRYVEGLWDNVRDWIDGVRYEDYGMYIELNPTNWADTSGGTLVCYPENSAPPIGLSVSETGDFPLFYPVQSGSDIRNTNGTCDQWGFTKSAPCLFVGGDYNQGMHCGMFNVFAHFVPFHDPIIGVRLLELP